MFVPDAHYVKIGSINTCYWAEGAGSPVVLVHGLGGSAAGWLPSFAALSQQHRVYAPDLVGHGRTDKLASSPASFPDLIKFLHNFMLEMDLDCAHLIGHSMGGAIALQLAIQAPACVRKLVLVDTSGLGRQVTPVFRIMSIPVLGELLASRSYTPDVKKYGQSVRSQARNAANLTDELIETLFRIEENPTQYKTTLQLLRIGVNGAGQKRSFYGPIVAQLPSVACPTLLIWGKQDDVVPLEHAEFAVKALPHARLEVIDQCGHIPMFDQPLAFNELVLDFLKD